MESAGESVLLSNTTYRKCADEATNGQFELLCKVLQSEYGVRFASRASAAPSVGSSAPEGLLRLQLGGRVFPGRLRPRRDALLWVRGEKRECRALRGSGQRKVAHGGGARHHRVQDGLPHLLQHAVQLAFGLSAANAAGELNRKISRLARCDMIILDEWGHLPTDPEDAKLLFLVIPARYERVTLVIAINIDFSRWGKIFNDEDMAAAMLDRVAITVVSSLTGRKATGCNMLSCEKERRGRGGRPENPWRKCAAASENPDAFM